ncbi:SURF1 family protein [Actinotalea sp. M2MS4P-6]|uniref:SURF1 family protein n=1 Tax=Actinotalea sp. M2MS4P-6 TaxID=2983762 RepID=UPI0021E4902F|nr:SURF1 family protein [Actinotalea sp. M2MS4P-6]MCV2395489.1 SURF1 family protein [Actinotalea sp. M2MS4P-6]
MTPTLHAKLRAARSPRMLVMLLVLVAAGAVFARLGIWQLDRALQRGEAAAQAEAQEAAAAPAADLTDVLEPQTTFTSDLVARHVTTSGQFEVDQLIVVGRYQDGEPGVLALAPFRVADTGAVLAVVRGWAPSAADVAPAPTGEVELTGWLQAGEAVGAGFDGDTTDAISPAELVNRWGGPTYTAYLVLEAPQQDGLTMLPAPGRLSSGIDWRNLGYALQWWLFGLFAVALWWRMVGDEARDRAQRDAVAPDPVG